MGSFDRKKPDFSFSTLGQQGNLQHVVIETNRFWWQARRGASKKYSTAAIAKVLLQKYFEIPALYKAHHCSWIPRVQHQAKNQISHLTLFVWFSFVFLEKCKSCHSCVSHISLISVYWKVLCSKDMFTYLQSVLPYPFSRTVTLRFTLFILLNYRTAISMSAHVTGMKSNKT